jgi:Uncharacterized conserved protein
MVFLPTLLFAVITLIWVVVEPRRVACAVFFGLTISSLVLTLSGMIVGDSTAGVYWLLGFLIVVLLVVLVLAVLLIWSGIALIHREGFRLAHSLSLVLGILAFAYPVSGIVFVYLDAERFVIVLLALGIVVGYFAFILVSYLVYSGVYGFFARHFFNKYELVVVLGAGIDGRELTPLLKGRVDLGITRYRKSDDALLVLSGGQGGDEEVSEARAMADYALLMGVPRGDILLEDQSRTTEQNLRYSKSLGSETTRWLVVTSDYHAFRAACLMRKQGMRGAAVGSRTRRYFWASAVLREYIAMLRNHLGLNVFMALLTGAPFILIAIGWLLS